MREDKTALQRLDFIDVAKAIGIIAVMMSHSIGFPYNTGYYFTASYMALFFVLSGYTYKDGRTVKGNIVRRTVKIGKAYFFYSACLYIMTVASKIVLHSGLTKDYLLTAASGILYSTHSLYYPRTVEPNISFFLVQNAPLWYLTCFIVAGGLFDIAFNIAKNHRGGGIWHYPHRYNGNIFTCKHSSSVTLGNRYGVCRDGIYGIRILYKV